MALRFGPNPVRFLPGGLVEMDLTQGQVTIFDVVDLPLVIGHRWQASKSGRTHYARTMVGRKPHRRQVTMHGLLLGCRGIDHANGDGLDNRRANLRRATQRQNVQNRPTWSRSGFKGVELEPKTKLWKATIHDHGQSYYLGCYATAEEAARVYDAAAREHFGQFARLNFPESERGH